MLPFDPKVIKANTSDDTNILTTVTKKWIKRATEDLEEVQKQDEVADYVTTDLIPVLVSLSNRLSVNVLCAPWLALIHPVIQSSKIFLL